MMSNTVWEQKDLRARFEAQLEGEDRDAGGGNSYTAIKTRFRVVGAVSSRIRAHLAMLEIREPLLHLYHR